MLIAISAVGMLSMAGTTVAWAQRTGTLVRGGESSAMVNNSDFQRSAKAHAGTKASREEIDSARRTMRQFASCTMLATDTRREHEALVTFLKTPADGPEATALANRAGKADCLRFAGGDYVQMTVDAALFRGELFRMLYLDTQNNPPRVRVGHQEISEIRRRTTATAQFYSQVGECLVKARPAEARAMVLSNVASREEDMAVRAIAPVAGECVPKGVALQLSREMLDGLLAEALYWQAVESPAQAGMSGNA